MKPIKFKIAIKFAGGLAVSYKEIPGYLLNIHGIPIVVHNWHYLRFSEIVEKTPEWWSSSEYYSGCQITGPRDLYEAKGVSETRKQIIELTTKYLGEQIKRIGKKKVLETINARPKINDQYPTGE